MTRRELLGEAGQLAFLLGNEAVARGALEAGMTFAAAYPGTPSTEVIEALISVSREVGIHVEWSSNEKVAYEAAVAASMSGHRAMAVMKHVGLNVASDPFMSSAYAGVNGGLVLVVADDPSMHSSQNEQDSRIYGLHGYVPILEPSSPQECKDYAKLAFELSERYDLPVMVRLATRVSHARGPVRLGVLSRRRVEGKFLKDPNKWSMIPSVARRRRISLLERFRRVSEEVEELEINAIFGDGVKLGVITAGVAYPYVVEAIKLLDIEDKVRVFKLGMTHPLPRRAISRFLESVERVLVVEELEPFLETGIKVIAFEEGLAKEIHGKDLVPVHFELTPERVTRALAMVMGLKPPVDYDRYEEVGSSVSGDLPPRPPVMCPGCPHRASFFALKRALRREGVRSFIASSDIGCYALGFFPPYELADMLYDMGSSIGIGYGLAKSQKEFVVSIIGDSTFFHAGLPAVVNAVYNRAPLLIMVLDNYITAMTGQQPHPGTGVTATGEETKRLSIADVSRGLGVEYVVEGDPLKVVEFQKLIQGAIRYVREQGKPAVVVARSPCVLYELRRLRRLGVRPKLYGVIPEECTGCRVCVDHFACPAISMVGDKAFIDPELCTGCGACTYACPFNAIVEVPRP